MAKSLNLSLTNELRDFIDSKSGDGTDYSTPTEYVRGLIRADKKAEILRSGQLGYQVSLLRRAEEMLEGNYIAHEDVRKNILNDL